MHARQPPRRPAPRRPRGGAGPVSARQAAASTHGSRPSAVPRCYSAILAANMDSDDGVESIDKDQLILLVEARPVLWNRELEDYKSRSMTAIAWRQVCGELNPDFAALSDREKTEYTRFVMRKWTNIKDSWIKAEKRKVESSKPGSGKRPCRRYIYAKQLSFLRKNLKLQGAEYNFTPKSTRNNKTDTTPLSASGSPEGVPPTQPAWPAKVRKVEEGEQTTLNGSESPEGRQRSFMRGRSSESPVSRRISFKRRNSSESPESRHVSCMRVSSSEGPENRHISFMRGILPSLAKFSDEQVVEFQMGVLNVLQSVREGRRFSDPASVHSQPFHLPAVYPQHLSNPPRPPATQDTASAEEQNTKAEGNDKSQQIIIPTSPTHLPPASDVSENSCSNQ
ncbi:uncharacterized protein LOC126985962 [Eriocheir sinensis]|uniref:uncharacterized protein LOC126985962 n=1 Tax=Eriocheir sinensis TaxID=95602 RepID=UPI0021C8CD70|nr:uncharacterized protein LOC126985962 [Eriocheir sinensis]